MLSSSTTSGTLVSLISVAGNVTTWGSPKDSRIAPLPSIFLGVRCSYSWSYSIIVILFMCLLWLVTPIAKWHRLTSDTGLTINVQWDCFVQPCLAIKLTWLSLIAMYNIAMDTQVYNPWLTSNLEVSVLSILKFPFIYILVLPTYLGSLLRLLDSLSGQHTVHHKLTSYPSTSFFPFIYHLSYHPISSITYHPSSSINLPRCALRLFLITFHTLHPTTSSLSLKWYALSEGSRFTHVHCYHF